MTVGDRRWRIDSRAGDGRKWFRYRFDEATCDALLEIAWWDWDAEKVTRNVRAICGGDLEALRAAE